MEGPKQAVHRRKPTNITEFKWFFTKEWAKTPTCYCAGLISIYKKLYLQLLQQKGVTPDTESKDSHAFSTHGYVTLDHFSYQENIFILYSKGLTYFQAALYINKYVNWIANLGFI